MTQAYVPTRFDVTGEVVPLSDPLSIAAWVFAPASPVETRPVVLICLPGGSYTKAYYHLEVPGFPPDAYSFALHMVKQGFVVVALDHLGVGESTCPADGTPLTMEVMAKVNAVVTEQVRSRLAEGTLVEGMTPHHEPTLVGIGHSMGAFLLVTQQADHHSFDAIAPLGYTNKEPIWQVPGEVMQRLAESLGMPPESTLAEIMAQSYGNAEHGYLDSDRTMIHLLFYADDVPTSVIEADEALATRLPAAIMVAAADPQYMLTKAARIEVPVFLGNGDLDVSADFRAEVATYPLARDITLFKLAGSAHCHNFATTRHLLWDRLARWIAEVNPKETQ